MDAPNVPVNFTESLPENQRAAFLTLADRIVRRFSDVTDLSGLGAAINEAVDQLTEVEQAGFFVVEPGTQRLRLVHVRGFSLDEARESERTAWARHPGLVVRTGCILDIPDVDLDPERLTSSSARSFNVRARMWVPVYDQGSIVGAFGLGSPRPHAFGELHMAALLLLASVTAVTYRRVLTARALRRSDAILSAVAASAELLLGGPFDHDRVGRVLARLGNATEVSRVYVFEMFADPSDGALCARQTHEWTATGVEPQMGNEVLQHVRMADMGYGRWGEVLPRNQPIIGAVDGFPESEHELLASQGIVSLCVVPIFVGMEWWGLMGFDDCVTARQWTHFEVEALSAAARSLGAAVQRDRAEAELRRRSAEQRLLLDNIETHIFYLTDPQTYGAVNEAHAGFTGRSASEFEGRPIRDLLPPEVADVCEAGNRRVFDERRRLVTEEYIPNLHGEPRVFSVIKTPWLDADGRVAFVVASAEDVTEARRAQAELAEARADLERKVLERTHELSEANDRLLTEVAERRRAEALVIAHREKLRAMASDLFLAEERERRRISTLLHDHVGQALGMARMHTSAARHRGRDPSSPDLLDIVLTLLDDAIRATRALTFELSPPILYELGLVPALEWLADRLQAHGIVPTVSGSGGADDTTPDERVILFEAARELLLNVTKHAQARHVTVHVAFGRDRIELTVADDGVWLPSEDAVRKGFGLFSIRERLEALGGTLSLHTSSNEGTRAVVSLPRQAPNAPSRGESAS